MEGHITEGERAAVGSDLRYPPPVGLATMPVTGSMRRTLPSTEAPSPQTCMEMQVSVS